MSTVCDITCHVDEIEQDERVQLLAGVLAVLVLQAWCGRDHDQQIVIR